MGLWGKGRSSCHFPVTCHLHRSSLSTVVCLFRGSRTSHVRTSTHTHKNHIYQVILSQVELIQHFLKGNTSLLDLRCCFHSFGQLSWIWWSLMETLSSLKLLPCTKTTVTSQRGNKHKQSQQFARLNCLFGGKRERERTCNVQDNPPLQENHMCVWQQ